MRAIDTNALVRLIVRDDVRQVESVEDFIQKGAWVSLLALAETIWVLRTIYDINAASQIKILELLLDHRDLVLQESEAVSRALALFRAKPTLGFSDCLMLEMARNAGHLPLGTFDRNLARVEGAQRL